MDLYIFLSLSSLEDDPVRTALMILSVSRIGVVENVCVAPTFWAIQAKTKKSNTLCFHMLFDNSVIPCIKMKKQTKR